MNATPDRDSRAPTPLSLVPPHRTPRETREWLMTEYLWGAAECERELAKLRTDPSLAHVNGPFLRSARLRLLRDRADFLEIAEAMRLRNEMEDTVQ